MARVSKQDNKINYKELYGKTLDEVDLEALLRKDTIEVGDKTVNLNEIDKEVEKEVKAEKTVEDYEKEKKIEQQKKKELQDSIKDFQKGKKTQNQKGMEIVGLVAVLVIWIVIQGIMIIAKLNSDMNWGTAFLPTVILVGLYIVTLIIDIINIMRDKIKKSKNGGSKK